MLSSASVASACWRCVAVESGKRFYRGQAFRDSASNDKPAGFVGVIREPAGIFFFKVANVPPARRALYGSRAVSEQSKLPLLA